MQRKEILNTKDKALLQKNTARLTLLVVSLLALVKFILALLTSSVAILASAMDSLMDIAASGINFFSIKKSLKPADYEHQFGHGKAESLAGFNQSILMIASAGYVIYLAIKKWYGHEAVARLDLGILVMLFSTVVSIFLYKRLIKVARVTESIALKADSVHYLTDILTNAGVLISLCLIYFTKFFQIDFIISILIAVYIIWMALKVLKESIDVLMDKALPDKEIKIIHDIIQSFYPNIISYHQLRTRKAGRTKFIDLHIVMPNIKSFKRAHTIAENLTVALQEKFQDAQISIHIDPRDDKHKDTNKGGGIYCALGLTGGPFSQK